MPTTTILVVNWPLNSQRYAVRRDSGEVVGSVYLTTENKAFYHPAHWTENVNSALNTIEVEILAAHMKRLETQ